ncbi:MAG: aminotransferase class V-fold PLP-dependent enzyme [Thermoanaerobacteraceae bacterium]|nr:aminotransferase class V-fold PLP-dependent enzyme [Thermoanaerobacteraceae bacterium]
MGDLGVVPSYGRPTVTSKVESVIADFFGSEDAVLVRGAGTGAIRFALQALLKPGDRVLIHDAPVYSTTATTIEYMGLELIRADMNDTEAVLEALSEDIKAVYIQHSRQKSSDRYDMYELIEAIRDASNVPIITDENYTVLKTRYIGTQVGANASCFSCFKLLGPEGIGCIVCDKNVADRIREMNYSGGGQVQGHEAMEALRSMIYVPVMVAIQAEEINKVADAINSGMIEGAKAAYITNAQSRTILVELCEPISAKVIEEADSLGAATHPVGAESRYEATPMFYRASGTFIKDNPEIKDYMIRVNPMRAGSETVLRILKEAIEKAR